MFSFFFQTDAVPSPDVPLNIMYHQLKDDWKTLVRAKSVIKFLPWLMMNIR